MSCAAARANKTSKQNLKEQIDIVSIGILTPHRGKEGQFKCICHTSDRKAWFLHDCLMDQANSDLGTIQSDCGVENAGVTV
jgi:hypothetical protein